MITEFRIRNTTILAVLVLLGASAGCIGGPDSVSDRDIVVLKLASDGSTQWTRTIDTGEDDGAEDLIELPRGGFAIAAHNGSDPRHPARPRFVRLAADGAILWDRFVTDGSDIAKAVVPTGDGGTAVLTGNGTVGRFDPAGRTLWTRTTGISEAQALLPLADDGFTAAGGMTYNTAMNITIPPLPGRSALPDTASFITGKEGTATRLAADGSIVWERRYGESGLEQAQLLVESADGVDVLLVGVGAGANATLERPLLALPLATDGRPRTIARLGTEGFGTAAIPSGGRAEPAGYRVLYWDDRSTPNLTQGGVVDALLDRDGHVLERRELNASFAVARTADGGYVSVGLPRGDGPGYSVYGWAPTSAFHVLRFDPSGTLLWDLALPTGLISSVKKVVPTADGGYAILAMTEKG